MAAPPENPRGGPLHRGHQQSLEERALEGLASAFEADGWRVSRPEPGPRAPALLCRKSEQVYAVELEASPGKARRAILRARLADAILRARVKARENGAQPLAVLAGSSFSAEIARELAAYVAEFGDGSAWGAIDERGRFDLHGPGLDALQPARPNVLFDDESAHRSPVDVVLHNPFSDLGQWMLKVLLAPRVPERWLHAPRGPVRGVADLAERAGVSASSASRFLSALELDGHVGQADGVIELARVAKLLDAYRAASQRPFEERLARFLLPSSEPEERLRDVLAARHRRRQDLLGEKSGLVSSHRAGPPGERACLALFSACRELGVGFVRGAPVHLYAERLSNRFLKELELQPVEHRAEADLVVRRPRFPEAVFRACVLVGDVPAADAVQCWLDVSLHAARGAEQALEIANKLGLEQWGS